MIRIHTSELMIKCRKAIEDEKERVKCMKVDARDIYDVMANACADAELIGLNNALLIVFDVLMEEDSDE